MALDIRKTRYDTADVTRMLKDVQNYDDIPQTVWKQIADSSGAMDAIVASSTVMNIVVDSPTTMNIMTASLMAMDAIVASSTAMNIVVDSPTAMNIIWGSDVTRQALWSSPTARLAMYNNPTQLKALTVNTTPNLIDETPLNTDKNAGYLQYAGKNGGMGDWTAVNLNDSSKYLVWIHFYSYGSGDWMAGKIASYDQSTDLQITNGGTYLTRGNFNTTSNGLWVNFVDNNKSDFNDYSYARVWYIKV